jgi:hypothetical protein
MPATQRRRLDEIAEAAGAMARTADTIPDAIDGLADADRAGRMAFALQLRMQAAALAADAARGDVRAVEATVADIRMTCDRCHAAFRGLPPPRW